MPRALPGLGLHLRPAAAADSGFVYRARKEAMGEYIRLTWGWEESFQRHFHSRDFDPSSIGIIVRDGADIGYLAVGVRPHAVWLDQICLLPLHQRRGIGTALLRSLLQGARARGLPVRAEYLKVNPVGRLFRRLGFHIVELRDHHVLVERCPT